MCGLLAFLMIYLTDQSKTLLNQFLRSTSNIENNDLDILNEELKLSDVKELLQRYEDASELMNMDESERRRLGIHHNTYCHCHDNTCHCYRVVYIFWKIPIFKGNNTYCNYHHITHTFTATMAIVIAVGRVYLFY